MSKIYATDNFETQNWNMNVEDLASDYADLFIGFTDNSPVVEFKDLKFKFELRKEDSIKQYGVYPPAGLTYVNSDQQYLVVERLFLESEKTYTLWLWAENDKNVFEKEFEFTTPRPQKPHESWIWSGSEWEAPVPYPQDGNFYLWDEDNLVWNDVQNLGGI